MLLCHIDFELDDRGVVKSAPVSRDAGAQSFMRWPPLAIDKAHSQIAHLPSGGIPAAMQEEHRAIMLIYHSTLFKLTAV